MTIEQKVTNETEVLASEIMLMSRRDSLRQAVDFEGAVAQFLRPFVEIKTQVEMRIALVEALTNRVAELERALKRFEKLAKLEPALHKKFPMMCPESVILKVGSLEITYGDIRPIEDGYKLALTSTGAHKGGADV